VSVAAHGLGMPMLSHEWAHSSRWYGGQLGTAPVPSVKKRQYRGPLVSGRWQGRPEVLPPRRPAPILGESLEIAAPPHRRSGAAGEEPGVQS
jgi:hypothetical protein